MQFSQSCLACHMVARDLCVWLCLLLLWGSVCWSGCLSFSVSLWGAGIVQCVVCWARSTVWYSIAVWSEPVVEGIFPLESTGLLTPYPKTLAGESINWGLVMHAFHHIDSIDSDIYVVDGWMLATKNTPSMHHPWGRNVSTSMVGLKKLSHTGKSHQNTHQKCGTPEM